MDTQRAESQLAHKTPELAPVRFVVVAWTTQLQEREQALTLSRGQQRPVVAGDDGGLSGRNPRGERPEATEDEAAADHALLIPAMGSGQSHEPCAAGASLASPMAVLNHGSP